VFAWTPSNSTTARRLTNYQLAVAMRVDGQPQCPACGEPWPFIWNGCDWCGLPERPGDPISWQDFEADWSGIETFNIHTSCAREVRWDVANKGEYPMAAYTESMVTNAYLSHVRGREHHGWPDESCPLCWNLVHRLPRHWEPVNEVT
jgi:hypothetical protein